MDSGIITQNKLTVQVCKACSYGLFSSTRTEDEMTKNLLLNSSLMVTSF